VLFFRALHFAGLFFAEFSEKRPVNPIKYFLKSISINPVIAVFKKSVGIPAGF
jgi:hypothetical protein